MDVCSADEARAADAGFSEAEKILRVIRRTTSSRPMQFILAANDMDNHNQSRLASDAHEVYFISLDVLRAKAPKLVPDPDHKPRLVTGISRNAWEFVVASLYTNAFRTRVFATSPQDRLKLLQEVGSFANKYDIADLVSVTCQLIPEIFKADNTKRSERLCPIAVIEAMVDTLGHSTQKANEVKGHIMAVLNAGWRGSAEDQSALDSLHDRRPDIAFLVLRHVMPAWHDLKSKTCQVVEPKKKTTPTPTPTVARARATESSNSTRGRRLRKRSRLVEEESDGVFGE